MSYLLSCRLTGKSATTWLEPPTKMKSSGVVRPKETS